MPVYLRAIDSGAYFKSGNQWTPHPKQAHDFEERDRAIRVAMKSQLEPVDLIVTRDDGSIAFAARLANNIRD